VAWRQQRWLHGGEGDTKGGTDETDRIDDCKEEKGRKEEPTEKERERTREREEGGGGEWQEKR
jgi:hypothetical protein